MNNDNILDPETLALPEASLNDTTKASTGVTPQDLEVLFPETDAARAEATDLTTAEALHGAPMATDQELAKLPVLGAPLTSPCNYKNELLETSSLAVLVNSGPGTFDLAVFEPFARVPQPPSSLTANHDRLRTCGTHLPGAAQTIEQAIGSYPTSDEFPREPVSDHLGNQSERRAVAETHNRVPENVIYIRSARFGDESARRQQTVCLGYARLLGVNADRIYTDDRYSGAGLERPALKEMVEAARSGQMKRVIVEDADRLARDLALASSTFKLLTEFGVEVHSASHRAQLNLIDIISAGALAFDQRKLSSARMAEGRRRAAAKRRAAKAEAAAVPESTANESRSRQALFSVKSKKLVQELVREVFARCCAGETPEQIATRLQQRDCSEMGLRCRGRLS